MHVLSYVRDPRAVAMLYAECEKVRIALEIWPWKVLQMSDLETGNYRAQIFLRFIERGTSDTSRESEMVAGGRYGCADVVKANYDHIMADSLVIEDIRYDIPVYTRHEKRRMCIKGCLAAIDGGFSECALVYLNGRALSIGHLFLEGIRCGKEDIVETMLDKKLDIKDVQSGLALAIRMGEDAITRTLLQYIRVRGKYFGWEAPDACAQKNKADLMLLMIAEDETKEHELSLLLQTAVIHASIECAKVGITHCTSMYIYIYILRMLSQKVDIGGLCSYY